jgi:membrane-bound lytic murein transglycosylase D
MMLHPRHDRRGDLRQAMRRCWAAALLVVTGGALSSYAQTSDEPYSIQDLYDAGAEWLKDTAPPEVWEEYDIIGFEEWVQYLSSIQRALQEDSYDTLSDWLPYARAALDSLKAIPAAAPYADWLAQRLDYFEVAEAVVRTVPAQRPPAVPPPRRSLTPPPKPPLRSMPSVPPDVQKRRNDTAGDLAAWKQRMQSRPSPPKAAELVPVLKGVFREEGLPEALVWIAEVESSFNPRARSPVGAAGLFQFMPATAERFGLSLRPNDQRVEPRHSARAASRYLRMLYQKFGDWPLVFAAYNAGEGRVSRLLKARGANSWAVIENDLPVETRMYVPKVLATIAVREGVDATALPAPSPRAALSGFGGLVERQDEPLLPVFQRRALQGPVCCFAARSMIGARPRAF